MEPAPQEVRTERDLQSIKNLGAYAARFVDPVVQLRRLEFRIDVEERVNLAKKGSRVGEEIVVEKDEEAISRIEFEELFQSAGVEPVPEDLVRVRQARVFCKLSESVWQFDAPRQVGVVRSGPLHGIAKDRDEAAIRHK